jgi:hypothetical protein
MQSPGANLGVRQYVSVFAVLVQMCGFAAASADNQWVRNLFAPNLNFIYPAIGRETARLAGAVPSP